MDLYVDGDLDILLIEAAAHEGIFLDWLHATMLEIVDGPLNFIP